MICNGCKIDKPFTEKYFPKNKSAKEGLEKTCKECRKKKKLERSFPIIYIIKCIPENKYYIGQTIKPLNDRISKHFSDAKRGRKQPLYEDIRKYNYNKKMFEYKEIERTQKENLDIREQYWISFYKENKYNLYNRELGGKSGNITCYETRLLQSIQKGSKPFLVYNLFNGEFVGKYNFVQEANEKLNVTGFGYVLTGKYSHTKEYIAFYEDEFTENKLKNKLKEFKLVNNNIRISKNKNRVVVNSRDVSGKNNPMFGKTYGNNPNSKSIYILNKNILEKYTSAKEAQEKYNFSARTYAQGTCNNYYKKLDFYIYYDYNLPIYIKDKIPQELKNLHENWSITI